MSLPDPSQIRARSSALLHTGCRMRTRLRSRANRMALQTTLTNVSRARFGHHIVNVRRCSIRQGSSLRSAPLRGPPGLDEACAPLEGSTYVMAWEIAGCSLTNYLTTFRDGAIVEFSSTAASRSPLRIDRCGAHEPAASGHGSFSFSTHFLVDQSRDDTSANHAIDRLGAVAQGHSARSVSVIRQPMEVRRAIHCRQSGQRRRERAPACWAPSLRASCAAHRRRSRDVTTDHTARSLRDDRTSPVARRDPHSPTRPVPRGRPAILARPEARAIAGGVTGDERQTTTVSKRGLGSDITIRLPDGSQYRERKRASRF